jgi:hypothetical protein
VGNFIDHYYRSCCIIATIVKWRAAAAMKGVLSIYRRDDVTGMLM